MKMDNSFQTVKDSIWSNSFAVFFKCYS